MPRDVIYTDQLMRPIAHFSHASRIDDVIHVGASAGVFPDLRLAGDAPGRFDMEAQTRRMFANLRTTLDLLGGKMSDVVRLKAYV
ncbi:Rid family hydrolase, partial [Acinetobacter baumannii]